MQPSTRKTIIDRLAKADALYYATGMSISILELALIATNKNFGASSLELSFLIQIIFSVIIESAAGVFFLRLGPYLTTVYGMMSKVLAVLLFGGAVISSAYFNLSATWVFLVGFFIVDGIGSGCLLSAFRPAYAKWFLEKMHHKEEADFLKIFKRKMLIRIGLPLIILLFSVLFFYVIQLISSLKNDYYFYSSIIIIGTMLATRLYQLNITMADFKSIKSINNEINKAAIITLKEFKNALNKVKTNLFIYIVGDIAFLSVMMYTVGLSFKLTTKISMPFYLAWLGGALIGFTIYLLSSLFGYFIYPKFSETFNHKKIIFALIFLILPTLSCGIAFYMDKVNYQIITLLIFSLASATIGNGLLRLMTNRIIRDVTASYQQAIFIFAETIACFIIAVSILISLYFANSNTTILTLLTFILLLGLASITMLMLQPAQEIDASKMDSVEQS